MFGFVGSCEMCGSECDRKPLPGSLARVTACLAEANANIEEVHHERAFTRLPVQTAEVDFVLETRGHDHIQQIIAALEKAGFKAKLHNEG